MGHSGEYTLYMDTSIGHQLQDEFVLVPVQYLATDVDHLVVIHLASTVTCGSVSQVRHLATTAGVLATSIYVMNNTTAASVHAPIPLYTVILDTLKPQPCTLKQ